MLLISCSTTNNRHVAGSYPHGDVFTKVRLIENFFDKEKNIYKCMGDSCKYIEISSLNDTHLSIKTCTLPFSKFKNIDPNQVSKFLKSNFSGQTCTSLMDNYLITQENRDALDEFISNQPFINKSGVRRHMITTGSFIAGAMVFILSLIHI